MSILLLAKNGFGRSASPSPPGIPAALKRYDGSSGTARFRGTVLFAPGEQTVFRVLVDGAEPAGGLYEQPLDARHHDGSIRASYIEFDATCGANETVACVVQLGVSRSITDLDAPADLIELSPRPWHAAPTLFGITDAQYLCDSRALPLPLVPLADAGVPESLRTYLTATFDEWIATTTAGSDAQYDELYPLICRYCCTGNLDDLAQALRRNQSDNSPTLQQRLPFGYYLVDKDYNSGSALDCNPSGFDKPDGLQYGNENGFVAEQWSVGLTRYAVYVMTGWEYARIGIERDGTQNLSDYYYSQLPNFLEPHPRGSFRWKTRPGVLGAIIEQSRYVNVGSVYRYAIPGGAYEHVPMATRVVAMIDALAGRAATIVPGENDVPSWVPAGIWGVSNSALNGTLAGVPNFMFVTAEALWQAVWNGIDTRSLVLEAIDQIAAWVVGQSVLAGNSTAGYPIYAMPYYMSDPATLPVNGNGTYSSVLAWLFAWHYRRTGDEAALALCLHVCDGRHLWYSLSQVETKTLKQVGEIYFTAFHTAALVAGAPLTGEA